MRVRLAGNGDLDAPDGGIVARVLQRNTTAHERRDQRLIVEEEGNPAASRHQVYAPGYELSRAAPMKPRR